MDGDGAGSCRHALPRRLKLMCLYRKRHHPHELLLEAELDVEEEALWHGLFNFPMKVDVTGGRSSA